MYTWFSTNDTNDKEIEFLIKIKSSENELIDISNYLISKSFVKLNSSSHHVFELMVNPQKQWMYNA